MESKSVYDFKRALEELSKYEGKGTELISLYVPPKRPISDVIAYLRDEYSTSSNIKSKTTRKNVMGAIESMMSRLRLYKMPPENGLALFIGHVPTRGDQTEMVTYIIEPPEPVQSMLYRCDSKFYLDPLYAMLGEKDVYGLIVIDRSEATVGFLRGTRIEVVKNVQSQVPSKHHQGGQSSRRFERLIELAAHEFFVKVGGIANEAFLNEKNLKGILIGGPGATKEFFAEKDYLHHELKKKIIDLFDTGYTDEYGLRELVEKASQTLEDLEISQEKKIINRFLSEVKKPGSSLAVYGEKQVIEALKSSQVDTLIISEALRKYKVVWECPSCKFRTEEVITGNIPDKNCPNCNMPMNVVEKIDIIDEYFNLAEQSNAKVYLVSNESEEGKLFLRGFGGIGAILRYRKKE
ncbi:MAG: peptide chain release factor aRF-1 [Thermoplasmata archaeon]